MIQECNITGNNDYLWIHDEGVIYGIYNCVIDTGPKV